MKKKGFTLIELLAVIVILAIIALIAIPVVLNMIENARKGASIDSAYGYIEAVNYNNGLSEVNDNYTKIEDGTYKVSQITNLKMKGQRPTWGKVTIVDSLVKEATLCINSYKIEYKNKKAEVKDGRCSEEPDETKPVIQVDQVTTTTKSIEIEFTAGDPQSGIKKTTCKATKGTETYNGTISGNKCLIDNLTNNQEYTYEIEVENNQELKETVSNTVTTRNFQTIAFTSTPALGEYASKRVITITGGGDGVRAQYYIGNDTITENTVWQEYTKPFEITENGRIAMRLYDGKNATDAINHLENMIDTTDPELEIGTVESTTNTITINITTNEDEESDIKSTTCKATNGNNTYNGTIDNNVCTITGLSAGTTYTYEIKTTNNANLSTIISDTKSTANPTITFDSNGGSSVSSISRAPGSAITLPTTTKTNYVFDGWYTAASGGTKITSTTMPSSSTTYHAHWTAAVASNTVSGVTTYYKTLQAAINASTGGSTNLLTNTSENITVNSSVNKSLILNNKTVTGLFTNNGTLSIGSGTMTNSTDNAILNYGYILLQNANVNNSSTADGAISNHGRLEITNSTVYGAVKTAITNYSGCTVTLNSGTVYSSNSTGSAISNSGTLLVKGGTLRGEKMAVYNAAGSTLTASGGTMTTNNTNGTNVISNYGTVTIQSNAIIQGITTKGSALTTHKGGRTYINGGTITATGNMALNVDKAASLSISAGSIQINVNIAYNVLKNAGTCTISGGTIASSSSGTYAVNSSGTLSITAGIISATKAIYSTSGCSRSGGSVSGSVTCNA